VAFLTVAANGRGMKRWGVREQEYFSRQEPSQRVITKKHQEPPMFYDRMLWPVDFYLSKS